MCSDADYMCENMVPTETTHYPCMRHCYLSDDGGGPMCSTSCHRHAESVEGLMVVFLGMYIYI
jgi:hypothetical protein